MFGMGGSEIIVILIVALIFLGPEKLPDAAKQISKGIRDLKRSTRDIQETIENDEHIGGAIRDLKSALRGEEAAPQPRPKRADSLPAVSEDPPSTQTADGAQLDAPSDAVATADQATDAAPDKPAVTLPTSAGEGITLDAAEANELAAMIKPAQGSIAKGSLDEAAKDPAKSS